MARKFGSTGSNRVGTGKVDQTASNTEKWAGSVAAQVATAAGIKAIVAKTVPIDYILCDPENPRQLAVTKSQIEDIAKQYPLAKDLLHIDEHTDWIEDYVSQVCQTYQLSGKAVGDLTSLVTFAATLKSADRLLHPIVVWKEESTFHLIAGERRLLAHVLLGESHIAARIVDQEYSREQIDALQWEENVQRQDMSLFERIEHVRKLLTAGEGIALTSVTKLSKILGRSRAESQRYLAVLRYPSPDLMAYIKEGKVSDLKAAAALAQLPIDELAQKFSGIKKQTSSRASIKLTDKSQLPQLTKILKAAAKQLSLEDQLDGLSFRKASDVNEAINRLLNAIEDNSNG
jgi:ParB/RepB/Spo0J family partition protein